MSIGRCNWWLLRGLVLGKRCWRIQTVETVTDLTALKAEASLQFARILKHAVFLFLFR